MLARIAAVFGGGMSATPSPDDPLWWLTRMSLLLNARNSKLQLYRDYYEGRHKLRFADQKFRAAFGSLFADYAENICELIVDSCAERLHVTGFRMGPDQNADKDAWGIWQANKLDAHSQILHKTSLIEGEAYLGVWSNPKDASHPLIRALDPRSTIVVHGPEDPIERRAAMRRWRDDWTGAVFATVYLPDGIYKYKATAAGAIVPPIQPEDADRFQFGLLAGWEKREVQGEPWPLPNPLKVVPIVPFPNMPTPGLLGISELATVIPVQDAINKLASDMLIASAFAGFPQRYGINLPLKVNPETGEVTFETGAIDTNVDRLIAFGLTNPGDPEPKFGEFQEASLEPFTKAIAQRLQMIATDKRVPAHYILGGQGTFPSGEALRAVEAPLVTKVRDKMQWLGEAHEEVIRLAFSILGDDRGKTTDSEVIWKDPENQTESQHVDALLKLRALDVPPEVLWERYGFTPVEIERMKKINAAEAAAAPAVPPSDPTQPGVPPVPGAPEAPAPTPLFETAPIKERI